MANAPSSGNAPLKSTVLHAHVQAPGINDGEPFIFQRSVSAIDRDQRALEWEAMCEDLQSQLEQVSPFSTHFPDSMVWRSLAGCFVLVSLRHHHVVRRVCNMGVSCKHSSRHISRRRRISRTLQRISARILPAQPEWQKSLRYMLLHVRLKNRRVSPRTPPGTTRWTQSSGCYTKHNYHPCQGLTVTPSQRLPP
jgi:hypothetical protein